MSNFDTLVRATIAIYLDSLRRRWVNDEIRKMELRLIDIALRRYWQG